MGRGRWPIVLTVGLIATLVAGTGAVVAAEEEGGGNNLATPVIFAEGYGLSGFTVDRADPTTTGMPGLLKPVCDDPVTGIGEHWGDSATVTYLSVGPDYRLTIDGTVYDEEAGVDTATPGDYFLQPYTLQPLIPPEPPGTPPGEFGGDTCWEADWADGSAIVMVEADAVDVGDSLVRTLRSEGPNPIRVEFSLFQTAVPAGTFQDGTLLDGYPMTQLWPPAPGEGKPPSVGGGEKLEVWGTSDVAGAGVKAPAEQATVFSQNARLTIDRLTWAALPDSFADGNLDGYPSGIIPDTFESGYQDWVESVEYDGVVGGSEGESGFSAEVNQGGRVLYGFNWGLGGTVEAGWYRLTLSIDSEVNGVAANASLTGVNPGDQLADESEGGSGGSSKGFFPPTFVEDPDGNYLYIDVYIAPSPSVGNGNMNGKVTDRAGAPLGGIDVTVFSAGGTPVGLTDTESDGLFGITLPTGTYHVGFSDPGEVYYDEYYDDRGALPTADDVILGTGGAYIEAELSDVAPPGAGRIKGIVENGAGDPLKGIAVTAYGATGEPVASTQTDVDGNYAMVLVAGIYNVGFSDPAEVYADEYYDDRTTLAKADDIVLEEGSAVNASAILVRAGQIEGVVRDQFLADPVAGATVTATDPDGVPVKSVKTDAEGEFHLALPAGAYKLKTSAAGYLTEWYDDKDSVSTADTVTLAASQVVDVDVRLSASGIKGTVKNEVGESLEGIAVTVYGPTGSVVADTLTDSDGGYKVVLVQGTYRVGFSDPAAMYADEFYDNKTSLADANPVAVGDGAAVNVSAILAKAARLTGIVRGEIYPAPLVGATVTATDLAGAAVKSVKTGADGQFVLALPAGAYKVRTSAAGYVGEWYDGKGSAAAADTLTVANADVIALDIRLFPANFFVDVEPDGIFAADIQWLKESGITLGCNPPLNDRFCPKDLVTRAQMSSFLVRGLGLTEGGDIDRFVDDDDSVHETDINRLAAAGITLGCNPPENDEFCPNDPVTRAQMASFLVRALDLTEGGEEDRFTDDDGSVHEADINRLAFSGITKGCNPPANTLFCPASDVLREQMAAFLHRALG